MRHSRGDLVDTLITVDYNGVLIAGQTIGELFTYLTYESNNYFRIEDLRVLTSIRI